MHFQTTHLSHTDNGRIRALFARCFFVSRLVCSLCGGKPFISLISLVVALLFPHKLQLHNNLVMSVYTPVLPLCTTSRHHGYDKAGSAKVLQTSLHPRTCSRGAVQDTTNSQGTLSGAFCCTPYRAL